MALVWKLDLPPNQRLVLLAYADHADDEGGSVFPSLGRIAWKTGYSRDQVRRISRELANSKLIEKVKDAGSQRGVEYRLRLERGSKLPPLKPRSKNQGVANDPSPPGANDPSQGGAPMPPKPSVEPSVKPSDYERSNERSSEVAKNATETDLGKYTTDRVYDAFKASGFPRWTKEEYGYHLGRVQKMLKENAPTDDELERLPNEFVDFYRDWNPKADAVLTLREIRRRAARKRSGAANGAGNRDEPLHPHSDEAQKMRDKPRKALWYTATIPGADVQLVEQLIKDGRTHSQILDYLGVAA